MAIQNDNTLVTKGDLKALYSDKIAPYLGANLVLKTNISDYYSEDEKIVGVWTDGRPVYQKTIDCGAIPNTSTKSVHHNISNLKNIIKIDAIGFDSSSSISFQIPYISFNDPTNYSVRISQISTTIIMLKSASDNSAYNCYVTLQYTKTTDAANSAVTTPGCYDINFPNTWPENKEIYFGNGLYGYRTTGSQSVTTTRYDKLINTSALKLAAQGGNVKTVDGWLCPVPWTYIHPTASAASFETAFYIDSIGLKLYIKSGASGTVEYDVWVTYTK